MRKIGKQRKAQDQISAYNGHVLSCLDIFKDFFLDICNGAKKEQLESRYAHIRASEKAADVTRRALENMMYTEAIFPESRGDILGLIEAIDRIANHSESSVRMVLKQHITVPPVYFDSVTRLVETCYNCANTLVQGVEQLFNAFMDAAITSGEVNRLESEADRIEENLIDRIFSSDESDLQKILLRDLIKHIAEIADSAETVGDRIRIMVAKRSI